MKEYPVGSVCVIVQGNGKILEDFVGMECVVEEGIYSRDGTTPCGERVTVVGYVVSASGYPNGLLVEHVNLKLKKFPGQLQSWLAEKIDKLTQPNPNIVLEEV